MGAGWMHQDRGKGLSVLRLGVELIPVLGEPTVNDTLDLFADRRAELKRRLPPNAHPRSRVRATQNGVWIRLSHSQMRILYRLFLDQLVLTLTCRPIGGRDSKPLAYLDAVLDHARRESSAKEIELIHRQESRKAQAISGLVRV